LGDSGVFGVFRVYANQQLTRFNAAFSSIPTALPKVLLSLLPLPPENPDWGLKGPGFGPNLAPNFRTVYEGDLMTLFRTRLRVLRAEREWSQAKLAAQVGVTRQTITQLKGPISSELAAGIQDCPRLLESRLRSVHLRGYLRSSGA